MELSDKANKIVSDITSVFDGFNISLDERDTLAYPVVKAYFIGKYGREYYEDKKISSLSEEVHLGLARDKVNRKYNLEAEESSVEG